MNFQNVLGSEINVKTPVMYVMFLMFHIASKVSTIKVKINDFRKRVSCQAKADFIWTGIFVRLQINWGTEGEVQNIPIFHWMVLCP